MKTCAEVRALEEAAFAKGVSADQLMEKAGLGIANEIHSLFGSGHRAIACLGKGNNGGDALVAARHLREWGWEIGLCSPFAPSEWSPLSRLNHERLGWPEIQPTLGDSPPSPHHPVLLDGLLGIGGRPGIHGPLAELARDMNEARLRGAKVVALDLPSGIDADQGLAGEQTIIADLTLTIGVLKKGLVADSATDHVGRLSLIELEELATDSCEARLITGSIVRDLLPPRPHSWHKGQAGRVAIIAGSETYPGAARLASLGAIRGGAGLVTLYTPHKIRNALIPGIEAEVIVRGYDSLTDINPDGFDVVAIGPGLGPHEDGEMDFLLEKITGPRVLDADALNLIASHPQPWLTKETVITPHPGEMARLFPESIARNRAETARTFTATYPATLLFKGARTLVAQQGQPLAINGTGGPGLATGGNGDVLTGLVAALIAQGLNHYDACRSAAWLAGRSADRLTFQRKQSDLSLLPTDIANHLGKSL